ncbi:carbonic anhydrase [Actinacidiphila rubida]|uniref:carbonic anhydrase n=1 Tax=Actinacidiphila rubida TaxID=310780 RepID=A0A1H8QP68_9ACTN|nr:carbonic anhydrase [Actinacidiphila rubida]SEO55674.1 carbonic anhydrase [Actinacidiphila rubida]
MNVVEALTERNADFAASSFAPGLRLMPSLKTIVIGCVDPRVDPEAVLGTDLGEVATIRNVGGRVTPGVMGELAMLRKVTQAFGGDIGPGWEFIVLHHTQCGITKLEGAPEALSEYFGVDQTDLAEEYVSDPHAAVTKDVEKLRSNTDLTGVRVSGLVYDVSTGKVETVVAP